MHEYIFEDNPNAAQKIAKKVCLAVELLIDNPSIGKAGRVHNTRELIVSGTKYIIPYRVKNNCIEILRVLHSSRQWPANNS